MEDRCDSREPQTIASDAIHAIERAQAGKMAPAMYRKTEERNERADKPVCHGFG
jgi:hypothetical protein